MMGGDRDGVWQKMRDEEGSKEENGQKKIALYIRRAIFPAAFSPCRSVNITLLTFLKGCDRNVSLARREELA